MGELLENVLIFSIFGGIALIVWSKVMKQSMTDTFREIKNMVLETREAVNEG